MRKMWLRADCSGKMSIYGQHQQALLKQHTCRHCHHRAIIALIAISSTIVIIALIAIIVIFASSTLSTPGDPFPIPPNPPIPLLVITPRCWTLLEEGVFRIHSFLIPVVLLSIHLLSVFLLNLIRTWCDPSLPLSLYRKLWFKIALLGGYLEDRIWAL